MGPTSSNFTIPGTESQRALDLLAEEFPEASGATGTIVVRAPEDGAARRTRSGRRVVRAGQGGRHAARVVGAVDPLPGRAVSPDGRYALVQVQFAERADEVTEEQRTAYEKVGAAAEAAGLAGRAGGEVLNGEPEVG